jgi:hypothetical protein
VRLSTDEVYSSAKAAGTMHKHTSHECYKIEDSALTSVSVLGEENRATQPKIPITATRKLGPSQFAQVRRLEPVRLIQPL